MDPSNPMHIGTKTKKIDISLEKQTKLVSQSILKYLSKGDIFFLNGEIGVGKTTFVRFLINSLQEKFSQKITEIPSPTFNLVHEYKIKDFTVMHYDLYRLINASEIENIGLFENDKNTILFVEWPKIIEKKPQKIIELYFNYEENLNKRSLIISTDYKKKLINEFR